MSKTAGSPLNPISSITMTDQAEQRLREYFISQGYKIGDALPKEIELASELGVSRSVIREALSRLRMLGMIDVRKRRGTILTEPDVLSGMERILELNFLGKETLKRLFEVRLMLEMGLGEFLFNRIDDQHLQKLDGIVKEEELTGDKARLIQLDITFHATLYEITGNPVLIRFQEMLQPIFQYVLDYRAEIHQPGTAPEVTHQDLLDILKNGNAASFREAMKNHFEHHFQLIT
ncbi:FadR/GntR family transcriptional regulator [Parapedobacter tibetensis]|uniref:FadR/GntR family transcriptional regulator n=1 Tax=Parapedobacter tibetensis TaxID=2972951 RepID=UPI00214D3A81|nr:FCD domain-containing protein [Parapedobacter tibetensis]